MNYPFDFSFPLHKAIQGKLRLNSTEPQGPSEAIATRGLLACPFDGANVAGPCQLISYPADSVAFA